MSEMLEQWRSKMGWENVGNVRAKSEQGGLGKCQSRVGARWERKWYMTDWNESMLADENLRNEISIYLLSVGNKISAKKIMEFLDQPDVKEKFGIEKPISHKTACHYLNSLGYRYKATLLACYL